MIDSFCTFLPFAKKTVLVRSTVFVYTKDTLSQFGIAGPYCRHQIRPPPGPTASSAWVRSWIVQLGCGHEPCCLSVPRRLQVFPRRYPSTIFAASRAVLPRPKAPLLRSPRAFRPPRPHPVPAPFVFKARRGDGLDVLRITSGHVNGLHMRLATGKGPRLPCCMYRHALARAIGFLQAKIQIHSRPARFRGGLGNQRRKEPRLDPNLSFSCWPCVDPRLPCRQGTRGRGFPPRGDPRGLLSVSSEIPGPAQHGTHPEKCAPLLVPPGLVKELLGPTSTVGKKKPTKPSRVRAIYISYPSVATKRGLWGKSTA